MPMYRFSSVMTGVAGAPYYNSLYVIDTSSLNVDAAAEAVHDFWDSLLEFSDDALIWTLDTDVQIVDPVTGQITGAETVTSQVTGGQNTGTPLPVATQGLMRFTTGVYEGGRQLRGRLFIPALTVGAGTTTPSGPNIVSWNNAWETFRTDLLAANGEHVIYSRTYHTEHVVRGASAWNQYAVQRSRRD